MRFGRLVQGLESKLLPTQRQGSSRGARNEHFAIEVADLQECECIDVDVRCRDHPHVPLLDLRQILLRLPRTLRRCTKHSGLEWSDLPKIQERDV